LAKTLKEEGEETRPLRFPGTPSAVLHSNPGEEVNDVLGRQQESVCAVRARCLERKQRLSACDVGSLRRGESGLNACISPGSASFRNAATIRALRLVSIQGS
jgi:hypothetical protein